jgi:hypothetical protein
LRLLLILTVAAIMPSVSGRETIHVDGIPVYGRVHDVTRADIRAAIADCENDPAVIEVISSTDMRAYSRQRELGWTPMHRYPVGGEPGKTHWGCVGFDITLMPDVLRLIRSADQVYIFPVTFTAKPSSRISGVRYLNPHGHYDRSRSLSDEARRRLAHLLGYEKQWFHGNDSRISFGPEPRNVGFLFQRGRDELKVFCSEGGRLEGPFNGQLTGGSLEEKPEQQLEKWKQRYAAPELAAK